MLDTTLQGFGEVSGRVGRTQVDVVATLGQSDRDGGGDGSVRMAPWAGCDVPLYVAGHSMGGQATDSFMQLMGAGARAAAGDAGKKI